MNDLELLDKYCETCLGFIDPFTFQEVRKRGLASIINKLPKNPVEAKAVVRGRLASMGRSFGDEQIDDIANYIKRLESLRSKLNSMNMADPHQVLPVLKEMQETSEMVLAYLK